MTVAGGEASRGRAASCSGEAKGGSRLVVWRRGTRQQQCGKEGRSHTGGGATAIGGNLEWFLLILRKQRRGVRNCSSLLVRACH